MPANHAQVKPEKAERAPTRPRHRRPRPTTSPTG